MRLQMPQVYRGFLSLPCLELARIGSLHFTFAASPSDQISDEKAIDTYATRLLAQALSLRFKRKSFVLGIKPLAKLPLFLSS